MDKPVKRKPGRRRRQPLSAERIAAEALALVSAEGLEGFSFRVLAARLGCETMSIYHYFPSKQHLFDAMVEHYFRDMKFLADDAPWIDRIRNIGWEFRALALKYPGFFQFVSIYRMNSRVGLRILDKILRAFEASGLAAEARARHFRVLGYYLMGAGLDEALGYARGPSAAEPVPEAEAQRDFPAVMAVGPFFGPPHHAKTFEQGLETLLARMVEDAELPIG